jgi:DNA-binding GntR family transcriptional regulator
MTLAALKPNASITTDRSTSALVIDALRQAIIQNELKPGERLRQDAVATHFGVSQTVAREAFKDLVREGFLASEPRRGVSVATMSADEAAEITRLRSLVEAQALEWSIPHMVAADLSTAEAVLKELDKARVVDDIIRLNAKFHHTLYQPAGRPRTLTLVDSLRMGFERYLRFTWEATSHRDQSQDEHRELLQLCKVGDTVNACALLKSHISATGMVLVNSLNAKS